MDNRRWEIIIMQAKGEKVPGGGGTSRDTSAMLLREMQQQRRKESKFREVSLGGEGEGEEIGRCEKESKIVIYQKAQHHTESKR